jgi:signal transduction histidine kinase
MFTFFDKIKSILKAPNESTDSNGELLRMKQELEKENMNIQKAAQESVLFTRFLVHDLKNSLFVANHYVKKSKATCVDKGIDTSNFEKAQRAIDTVIDTLERAKELEATEAKKVANFDEFDLTKAIEESIENMCFMANDKGIELTYNETISKRALIKSDRMLLIRSVLENILSNAIKFSYENSHVDIRLSDSQIDNEEAFLISIQDYGMGIPQHFLEFLFNTDEKTVGTGTHGERGTGFGLLIVKKVLDQLGGSISVCSTEKSSDTLNHGTTFSIKLPLI